MSHAHVTITRIDEPARLYAATFTCDRLSHVVPSGFTDTPGEAVSRLMRVLRDEKSALWASRVSEVAGEVESYFKRHPDADDVEFTVTPV